ncbi:MULTISPECIES: GNAT family N-acetyltransferase [unclassified Cellulomonas]|uniref:GNAT family N-acetyltransferase n=1 Tax=unclassified Cellulomonas TaxID=2620175 RepID=UPI0024B6B5A3|nr:GNAT family N-acetyltransferase [Cellulomonas sp. ES6]WHP17710.1 GNAT family N-acetyltransferase [Cellulomonas sp. ES6]
MPSPVAVRPARPEDLDVLVALSLAARAESVVGAQLCTDDADRLRHQIGALVGEPGACGLVGLLDGEVCGLALARIVGPSLFTDEVAVSIEAVYVAEGARRRGVGHALLGAVVEEAQRAGAADVLAVPLPGARGMLRFLARLGFAPAAAHRVASTEALQRRLVADAPARRSARVGLDDLIARRRRARAGRAATPAEAAVAQTGRSSISMQVSRAEQIRRPRGSSTTTS